MNGVTRSINASANRYKTCFICWISQCVFPAPGPAKTLNGASMLASFEPDSICIILPGIHLGRRLVTGPPDRLTDMVGYVEGLSFLTFFIEIFAEFSL